MATHIYTHLVVVLVATKLINSEGHAIGVPFDELMHRLVEIARHLHRQKNSRVRSFDVNLLSAQSLSGLKGAKR